jgi:hypothetical protein
MSDERAWGARREGIRRDERSEKTKMNQFSFALILVLAEIVFISAPHAATEINAVNPSVQQAGTLATAAWPPQPQLDMHVLSNRQHSVARVAPISLTKCISPILKRIRSRSAALKCSMRTRRHRLPRSMKDRLTPYFTVCVSR